jgi:hypothetical protein
MNSLVKPLTLILGVVLTLVGLAGFFMPSPLFGLFEVDTVHNIVHLASGLVALWAGATSVQYSRMFLIIFGIVYGLVAVLGYVMVPEGGKLLGLMAVNSHDHWLHALIAVACLAVGFGSKKTV